MTLSEKIYYCRKKAGLSQEALAGKLGVSRQAISKWETGDAEPGISNLKQLAQELDVSVDWLISDADPEPEKEEPEREAPARNQDWVESLPGAVGKIIRRYGWLAGVYMALSGAGMTFAGGMGRFIVTSMMGTMNSMTGGLLDGMGSASVVITDEAGNIIHQSGMGQAMLQKNPVYMMGTFIMVLGIVLLIAGVVLAIVLKKKSRK